MHTYKYTKFLIKILATWIQHQIKRIFTMTKLCLSLGFKVDWAHTSQQMWFTTLKEWKMSYDHLRCKKALGKVYHCMIRNAQDTEYRRYIQENNFNKIKPIWHPQWWKAESFSSKIRTKQGCPLIILLFSKWLYLLARAIK